MKKIVLGADLLIGQTGAPTQYRPGTSAGQSHQPTDVAAFLQCAVTSGAGALLSLYDPSLLNSLKSVQLGDRFDIYPLVPNMPQYIRDMSSGVVGAALKRVRRLQPQQLVTIGLRNALRARGVLKRDFRAVVPVMLEMELAGFSRFRPKLVFLHAQLTDLLVAAGNTGLLHHYTRLVRRTYGAEPALQTRNLGYVWPRLKEWQIDIKTVAAPFNAKGYRMNPSPVLCEEALLDPDLSLLAEDIDAGGSLAVADGLAYLSAWPVAGAVIQTRDERELDTILRLVKGNG